MSTCRYRGGVQTKIRVGAAFPDPPFNAEQGGLDIDLMEAIASSLGLGVEFVPFRGADFNGIFDALNTGQFDCVAAGTTVTPDRRAMAAFCAPYLVSGQSLAVDTTRLPHVRSIDDLAGLTIGVQHGNTSQPIADMLVEQGRAAHVRVYEYGAIRSAITDLGTGACDVFMKLGPVLTELVRDVNGVQVVQRGITAEAIAIAVPITDEGLHARIDAAQADLEAAGALSEIRDRWLGSPWLDQSYP